MSDSSRVMLRVVEVGDGGRWPASMLPAGAIQQELFGAVGDTAATGFALEQALAGCTNPSPYWLWVQDQQALRRSGRPFVHGLPERLQSGLVHVAAQTAEDALFALEEGLRCRDFAFVLGELSGNPRALDFTASRRLSVASERYGVPLYLVRLDGMANLSAARRRWRIASAPSLPAPWDAAAPGSARYRAELFRARGLAPGTWIGNHHDGWHISAPHPVDLAAKSGHRPVAANSAA